MEHAVYFGGIRVNGTMGANISPQLQQLDRERSLDRSLFLKLYEEYTTAARNGDEATVDEKRFLIKNRGARLTQLDEKIRKRMLEEGVDTQLLLKEGAECDEFQVKVFLTQARKNTANSGDSQEYFIPVNPMNVSPSNWLEFWADFKAIHENQTMSKTAKFEHLKRSLIDGTRARKVIDAYAVSDDNYDTVIEQLQSRYGRDQVIIECMTRNLILLIQNPVSVRELYQKIESNVRDLKSLKSYKKEHDWMFVPLAEACLPQYLRGPWHKLKTHNERLVSLLDFLKAHAQEESRLPGPGSMMRPATSTGSLNSVGANPRAPQLCVFCDGKHKSPNCRNAPKMSYEERVLKIKEQHRCFNCLDGKHHIRFCRRPSPECNICLKHHYPIMCRALEGSAGRGDEASAGAAANATAGASGPVQARPVPNKRAAKKQNAPPAPAEKASPTSWKCESCTYQNSDEELICIVCDTPRTDLATNQAPCYEQLLNLADVGLIPNIYPFECTICLSTIPRNEGVVLKECLHNFCKECLKQSIELGDSPEVRCPYVTDNSYCEGVLLQGEVRELLSPEMFDKYLSRSISLAESLAQSIHCRAPNCNGWVMYDKDDEDEDGVLISFLCPVCRNESCLKCDAVHAPLTCMEYTRQQSDRGDNLASLKLTEAALKELLDRGQAMTCPNCKIIVQKVDGCDGMICTKCKTDLCWATKGARWGPKGKGDISGGCRCRVNNIPCHPTCNFCH